MQVRYRVFFLLQFCNFAILQFCKWLHWLKDENVTHRPTSLSSSFFFFVLSQRQWMQEIFHLAALKLFLQSQCLSCFQDINKKWRALPLRNTLWATFCSCIPIRITNVCLLLHHLVSTIPALKRENHGLFVRLKEKPWWHIRQNMFSIWGYTQFS